MSGYKDGQEIWVQLDIHIPWSILLGEAEVQTPENDRILVVASEIVGGVQTLDIGSKVTLNEDPENWYGVDGGCWRVTNFLHGKTGVVSGFEDPFIMPD